MWNDFKGLEEDFFLFLILFRFDLLKNYKSAYILVNLHWYELLSRLSGSKEETCLKIISRLLKN